ncbi:membrane-spanning 4-domains subfamily A member 4A-like isoform X1 [Cyprinus carpio]|uniref:Membrane-spanning 4-domains subfamily A member 4A-like isoform X1 n=1 Tax=Cyprinus carpio TaxID=7962 RepID=A0A9R0A135_CYPCA|nr:membrane-spanning 4-domains subfamily A member 4A-like isoform X1 [Cyprinus carpio]
METSEAISTDKVTVVIQINPQEAKDGVVFVDGQQARGVSHNTALKGFFKAQPKALGTVQIMIGVMVFLLGIVLTANFYIFSTISVVSGITVWGSFIYISTGSLSVAAQNKLHPCVLKASLGMNVISAITAGISIILMGADIGITTQERPNCRYGYDCLIPQGFGSGILGILLVFSILQLIISIFISAFACKATSSTDSTVVNVAVNQVNNLVVVMQLQ